MSKNDRRAIFKTLTDKEDTILFMGYGTYDGEGILPPGFLEDEFGLTDIEVTCSKYILESGELVWGSAVIDWCEEEETEKTLEDYRKRGYTIVMPEQA